MRRATYVSTSIVASSAQCASSTMQIVAPGRLSSSSTSRGSVGAAGPELGGEPWQPAGDVEERAERTRHREVVARAEQHTRRAALGGDERPHQARLADPGLTADQRDPAAPGHDRSERRLERGQRLVTLQQRRPEMLAAHGADHSAAADVAQRVDIAPPRSTSM